MAICKNIGYGYNDLTIIPAEVSKITSRKNINPFYENNKLPIFASPMSTIVSVENFNLWERNNITPILPRNIDYNIRYDFLRQGKWVALSLNEFEDIFINNNDFIKEVSVIPHVLIDVANGHMKHLIDMCKQVKQSWGDNIVIMAGNIANPNTYIEYCEAGIDYVRCSIGSGSCCTTSSNTAVHYPIASLIDKINEIKKYRIQINCNRTTKVIADGGIRNYNDVIKALALGADYVMIGGLFASFIESAGEIIAGDKFINLDNTSEYEYDIKIINKQFDADYLLNKIIIKGPLSTSDKFDIYKNCEGVETFTALLGANLTQYFYIFDIYNSKLNESIKRDMVDKYQFKKRVYGMSTKTAQKLIKNNGYLKTSEGTTKIVEVKYTMKQWAENMEAYLRSCMSYCNSLTLKDFIGNQTLIHNSPGEVLSVNK